MNDHKRKYSRYVKKATKHHLRGDWFVWRAGLQLAMDEEKDIETSIRDFQAELEDYSPNEIYIELEEDED